MGPIEWGLDVAAKCQDLRDGISGQQSAEPQDAEEAKRRFDRTNSRLQAVERAEDSFDRSQLDIGVHPGTPAYFAVGAFDLDISDGTSLFT